MTTNRSRPLDREISRQTFLRGGVGMLVTGAVCGCTGYAADRVSGDIANLSDLTGVFSPAWTSPAVANAHFNTMSTPYGPGWTFTCADTDLAPWDGSTVDVLPQPAHADVSLGLVLRRAVGVSHQQGVRSRSSD